MKLYVWDGLQLQTIQPPQMPAHARAGVYVDCQPQGQTEQCLHLWAYGGPDPVPPHHTLLKQIRENVPHVNGAPTPE
jgi:hypothetical protein